MTPQAVEAACAFVWRNYMLLHNEVSENDDRRGALYRFIKDLHAYGRDEFDLNILQLAGAVYLRKLDELGKDREARHAGAEAVISRLKSRIGEADPEFE